MRSKSILGLCFLLMGCSLFPPEDYRYLPTHDHAALLNKYQYISHTTSSIIYEAEISALAWYGGNLIYFDDEFTMEGVGTFQLLDFKLEDIPAGGISSTVLLIDQSRSYIEIDPYNNRTKAINKFLEDFASPNEFMVGGFSKSGYLISEPVEYQSNSFSSSWIERDFLFGLAGRTGGDNSLFDALDDAMDKLIVSSKPAKNIVVMLHEKDNGSIETISTVVTKANLNNIKIHVIYFGAPTVGDVWQLTEQTGGMLAICPIDSDIITVFDNFQRLLHTETTSHKLRIQFTPTGGNVISGNSYENRITIIDQFSDYHFNPVIVKIQIP